MVMNETEFLSLITIFVEKAEKYNKTTIIAFNSIVDACAS